MLLHEISPTINTKDDTYHNESFYAPIVAAFIKEEGSATWGDIYAHIELTVDLSPVDLATVKSRNVPRWKIIVNNLHLNRTLEGGKFGDIVRIKAGFAMKSFAERNNIPIIPDNQVQKKNPGNRTPLDIKQLSGKIVNKAYRELGNPTLKNSSNTRKEIELMIRKNAWSPEAELMDKAKEIINKSLK